MQNKIKLLLASLAIFIFCFWSVEKTQAATCWTGSCKAACSETEEVSTATGDGCSGGEVCCVAKATTSTNACADLVAGADCIMSDGKTAGTCQSGFCGNKTSSTSTTDTASLYSSPVSSLSPSTTSTTGWSSSNLSVFGLPDAGGTGDVGYVIMAILEWLLAIVGIVAVIAMVVSGIQYFFVATDEKMLERAKKTMTSAIIGLIVALSGLIAIYAVDTMLRAGYLF